ncbi:hypothetical protein BHE74_00012499 [Ensete ventricosum]|nr:hypothetical protein BHE74_00012499 [Ensete ventricosum]
MSNSSCCSVFSSVLATVLQPILTCVKYGNYLWLLTSLQRFYMVKPCPKEMKCDVEGHLLCHFTKLQVWGPRAGPYEFKSATPSSLDDMFSPLNFPPTLSLEKKMDNPFVVGEQ